jgi:CTP:molybdopterin cytidylyltransferase MocA
MAVVGLLLAAGEGRRMGRPKATVVGGDGVPWVVRAASVLRDAGCGPVLVTLGAGGEQVRPLLPLPGVVPVDVPDWSRGIGASLRAGLLAAQETHGDACVVHLVDLPDVGADVVRRVLAAGGPTTLARATFDGTPGHPVVLGRAHWAAVLDELDDGSGAGPYLRRHGALAVDCSDLADGADVDTPEQLSAWRRRGSSPPA